jgi:hypothetical protein
MSLPIFIGNRATIDPPPPDRHPVTLKEQSPEIIIKIIQCLDLCDQACLALTCKELATKVCFTTAHVVAAFRAEFRHEPERPKHLKTRVAAWTAIKGHRQSRDWEGVLGCEIGQCFWKNWRVKKWAFDVAKRRWHSPKFMSMEDERLSLVPVEPEPKENGFIFARMHVRYLEEDAEAKEKAEKAKDIKELEAKKSKKRAKKEKKTQDGGDRKRRRLA